MKRITTVLALLLACSGVAQAQDATVARFYGNRGFVGCGVFIGEERVLTAKHVAAVATHVTTNKGSLQFKVIKQGPKLDWTLVKVKGAGKQFIRALGKSADAGTTVTVMGDNIVRQGHIIGCANDGLKTATATVEYGMSGGPVCDSKTGKVLGIISAKHLCTGGEVLFVPIESIRAAGI